MNTLYHIGGTFYLGAADAIKHLARDAYFDQLKSIGRENVAHFLSYGAATEELYQKQVVPFMQEFWLDSLCSPFYRNNVLIENPTLALHDYPGIQGLPGTYTEASDSPYVDIVSRDGNYYPTSIYLLGGGRKLPQWKWTAETDDGKRMLTATNLNKPTR